MVSPIGGNVVDDKGWDEKVISTAMEASSSYTRYAKDTSNHHSGLSRDGI